MELGRSVRWRTLEHRLLRGRRKLCLEHLDLLLQTLDVRVPTLYRSARPLLHELLDLELYPHGMVNRRDRVHAVDLPPASVGHAWSCG